MNFYTLCEAAADMWEAEFDAAQEIEIRRMRQEKGMGVKPSFLGFFFVKRMVNCARIEGGAKWRRDRLSG